MEKVTAVALLTHIWIVVNHCATQCPPHVKINKVKDLALIFWSVSCLYLHQDFTFCEKHLEQAFFYMIFFHAHPFNEMFIVNVMTILRLVYIAASKEYLRSYKLFVCY